MSHMIFDSARIDHWPYNRIPTAIDSFFSHSNWQGVLTWYTTPAHGDPYRYLALNQLMRAYAQRTEHAIVILPSDHLGKAADERERPTRNCGLSPRPINTCKKDHHFGAQTMSDWARPVDAGLDGVRAPRGYDGRDAFNFNLVQIWLSASRS